MNLDMPGLVWHKGSQVHCPECDDHIANFARHIFQGDKIDGNMFDWKNQKIEWGEQARCKKCDSPFFEWHSFTNKNGREKKTGNFMKIKERECNE